jgi:hypothetical protein
LNRIKGQGEVTTMFNSSEIARALWAAVIGAALYGTAASIGTEAPAKWWVVMIVCTAVIIAVIIGLWLLWKRANPEQIPPPPPVVMTEDAFREAQRRYIEKHEKLVKPDNALAVELIKLGTDFGKMTVTYLVVGNGGGLAALLAIHPLLRDGNQIWLVQQVWVAVAFAIGLFLAVLTAAIGYLTFIGGIRTRWSMAHHNAVWISRSEFGTDATWVQNEMARHFRIWRRGDRFSEVALFLATVTAITSGLFWAGGAFLLARNVMAAFPQT